MRAERDGFDQLFWLKLVTALWTVVEDGGALIGERSWRVWKFISSLPQPGHFSLMVAPAAVVVAESSCCVDELALLS